MKKEKTYYIPTENLKTWLNYGFLRDDKVENQLASNNVRTTEIESEGEKKNIEMTCEHGKLNLMNLKYTKRITAVFKTNYNIFPLFTYKIM